MKDISEFIVGKQYKLTHDTKIYDCVYVAKVQACLVHDGKIIVASVPEKWVEYKEQVTLTQYAVVVKIKSNDTIVINNCLFDTEQNARTLVKTYEKYWELIEIISVTWTGDK